MILEPQLLVGSARKNPHVTLGPNSDYIGIAGQGLTGIKVFIFLPLECLTQMRPLIHRQ